MGTTLARLLSFSRITLPDRRGRAYGATRRRFLLCQIIARVFLCDWSGSGRGLRDAITERREDECGVVVPPDPSATLEVVETEFAPESPESH